VPDDAPPQPLKDRRLIGAFAAGDKAAAHAVMRAAAPIVARSVRFVKDPFWQADLVQEVLAKVWQHRARFTSVERAESFIVTIARNQTRSFLRRHWLQDAEFDETAVDDDAHTPETIAAGHELSRIVEEYVSRLAEEDRQIMFLMLGEMSITATQEAMAVTQWRVRAVASKFIAYLDAALGEGNGTV
jgi:RNA polymerase sigma factor (sigma-70 family)